MEESLILELKDIWVSIHGTSVLEGINLSMKRGDFMGVIGPNGGGKTTLLKVILGLITPSRGEVLVFGKHPNEVRKMIGYVPQHTLFDMDFPVSVLDVVLMGRYGKTGLFRRYNEADKQAAATALKTVGMLMHKDNKIGELSGGEMQRVFIARALVTEPELLLLDEPTASVDQAMQTEFYEILEDLKQRMAIILVSHDIGAVSVYVNEIACLNRQLFYHGSTEIDADVLEATYKCPVQMITHGTVPHRVLKEH